uniref:uncharacterized protein LOC118551133 n=1 Tax=Halichoerus grypus TaxID=9711 RepID=UPI0016599CDD
ASFYFIDGIYFLVFEKVNVTCRFPFRDSSVSELHSCCTKNSAVIRKLWGVPDRLCLPGELSQAPQTFTCWVKTALSQSRTARSQQGKVVLTCSSDRSGYPVLRRSVSAHAWFRLLSPCTSVFPPHPIFFSSCVGGYSRAAYALRFSGAGASRRRSDSFVGQEDSGAPWAGQIFHDPIPLVVTQHGFRVVYIFPRQQKMNKSQRQQEREHKQGEREREKQASCRAGSLMRGSIPGPWDHDLS